MVDHAARQPKSSQATGFASARLVSLLAISLVLVAEQIALAEPPVVTNPAYGGYVVTEQLPYQPTVPEDCPECDTLPFAGPSMEPIVIHEPYLGMQEVVPVSAGYDAAIGAAPPLAGKDSLVPAGARNGVFQKARFTSTYLPRFEDDNYGMTHLRTDVVFGLPFFSRETPLVITPSYSVRFMDGPLTPDVPPRLHDMESEFRHFRRLGDSNWIFNGAVTVGVYADDYSFDAGDAFRVTGNVAMAYETSPTMKWVFGVAYVNRASTDILPIVGFSYRPNDDVVYDLVFPNPRVAWRLASSRAPGCDERWVFVGAEFGGGVWAVQRAGGATDTLSTTDYRFFIGTERKIIGGLSRSIELGYVFNRELEYDSTPGTVDLDDTLFVRAGLVY